MYGSTNLTEEEAKRMNSTVEDAEKLEAFEARIARGEKIEPSDWMPTEYRKQLIRNCWRFARRHLDYPGTKL